MKPVRCCRFAALVAATLVGLLGRDVPPVLAAGDQGQPSSPSIDHTAVTCVVAGKLPRLVARVQPADEVSRVRVYFRGEGGKGWYSVEMKPDAGVYAGVLPKPKKELAALEYYIDATDREFRTARTPEVRAEVVSAPTGCKPSQLVAGIVTSASIVLAGPAGAPALPVGFASTGVVGAGAGLGTATLVAGGAVAAAGAATAVALSGGEKDAKPAPLTGVWKGPYHEVSPDCTNDWDLTMNIVDRNGVLSAAGPWEVKYVLAASTCGAKAGEYSGAAETLSGNATGSSVRFILTYRNEVQSWTEEYIGTLGADRNTMGGTWRSITFPPTHGTWSVTRQ
jgi:hypothetical protein